MGGGKFLEKANLNGLLLYKERWLSRYYLDLLGSTTLASLVFYDRIVQHR
jgi:hypothetical protein